MTQATQKKASDFLNNILECTLLILDYIKVTAELNYGDENSGKIRRNYNFSDIR